MMIHKAMAFAVFGIVFGCAAVAGPIEAACNRSDRDAANRQVCNCIQQVADMTLPYSDQRRAASFFKDPERAQNVRLSDTRADDAFWERYTNFGATAEAFCAPPEAAQG